MADINVDYRRRDKALGVVRQMGEEPVPGAPVRVVNATLHEQSADLCEQFAQLGLDVDPRPRGWEVPIDATWAELMAFAQGACDNAVDERFDGILVGGLTSQAIALALAAAKRGQRVFECVTERTRDEHDRFVFALKGIREIHLADDRDWGEIWEEAGEER
ncbi:MAG: hypothetical protein U9R79_05080 [Armatimonadota bacterium]|nr:hypothetical protein [Armatimonadota bacterium]